MAASAVSALPAVRRFLLQLQRDMAASGDVIMDGRDIGTVVLPGGGAEDFSDRFSRGEGSPSFSGAAGEGDGHHSGGGAGGYGASGIMMIPAGGGALESGGGRGAGGYHRPHP